MKSLGEFRNTGIKFLFTDIDDTLTTHGQLPASSYAMLWELHKKGIAVIPVTGRPAGWCDMIARFWPVKAVIGENGAFYFSYSAEKNRMRRVWAYDDKLRLENQGKLKAIELEILKEVPMAAVSADQFARLFDLAIDFSEDVPALPGADVDKIVAIFKKHGAQAKVSSIHVNGWFGSHDKLTMCKNFCEKDLGFDLNTQQNAAAFAGDSPNDEPMFEFFKNSFGVANVVDFQSRMQSLPRYVAASQGAEGFVEIGRALLR